MSTDDVRSHERNTIRLRYNHLVHTLATFAEKMELELENKMPEEAPWFDPDKPLYVSNNMDVCDNEEYAKKHWGDRYIKVYRCRRKP